MNVSVIIITYKSYTTTRNALLSLFQFSDVYETIVVDNNSNDGSMEELKKEFGSTKIITLESNMGFGYANNEGAKVATGELLFFLNNDTLIRNDVVTKLASSFKKNPKLGAIGPKLYYEDGSFQLSFGWDINLYTELKMKRLQKMCREHNRNFQTQLENKFSQRMNIDWLTGAAIMIRKDVFERVGGFDRNYFMYFEDATICRRIRETGFEIIYEPSETIIHLLGRSYDSNSYKIDFEYRRSQLRYYRMFNSSIENVLLRSYLILNYFFKYMKSLFMNFAERRYIADVIRCVLTEPIS